MFLPHYKCDISLYRAQTTTIYQSFPSISLLNSNAHPLRLLAGPIRHNTQRDLQGHESIQLRPSSVLPSHQGKPLQWLSFLQIERDSVSAGIAISLTSKLHLPSKVIFLAQSFLSAAAFSFNHHTTHCPAVRYLDSFYHVQHVIFTASLHQHSTSHYYLTLNTGRIKRDDCIIPGWGSVDCERLVRVPRDPQEEEHVLQVILGHVHYGRYGRPLRINPLSLCIETIVQVLGVICVVWWVWCGVVCSLSDL